jgi:alpha-mannosidase
MSTFRAVAAEQLVWQLGTPDRSDHEFAASPNSQTNRPVLVRIGSGDELRQWPRFHAGSANGAFGGRPYRDTVAFDLPATAPKGVFYLDVSLLFRQPRVPELDLEINGHSGRYYFNPDPMFDIGNVDDQFDPIRSVARRRLSLPARFFHAGENLLSFVAVDEPHIVLHNRSVGRPGDSGFCYDSLALTHDPEAASDESIHATFTPTVLFPRTGKGVQEECHLIVRFPDSWSGGQAHITIGEFTTQLEAFKPAEFGEARYPVLVPSDVPAGKARIELSGRDGTAGATVRAFDLGFNPARKWKVFYAPNEHLDIGYTDYRAKVAELHARNMDELLKVLAAHPDYRFNLDGSWILDHWLDLRGSRQTAQLAPHVRAGQIGVNAFYCCPATEYPSLEESFRNLYFSKELETRFGIPFDFALVSDVPSCSWAVPSVLASAGVRYFANGGNQDRAVMIPYGHWNVRSPFWWEGPDGQRVLAWFSSHYHQLKSVCGLPPEIESGQGGLPRFLRTYEQSGYKPDAVLLYGTEVENLPTQYDDASFAERWNAQFAYPQIITCRFSEFFRYIEKNFGDRLPVVRGTGGAYWADNFGILAAATARDRANQSRVISAETLAALTTSLDPALRFSRELDHDIWRDLLLYAEHNFGTSRVNAQPESDEVIGVVREKENQTVRAEWGIDTLMRRSMSRLADQIQTDGRNLIVFNPLNWKRSALVEFQVDRGTTLTNLATGQPVDYEVVAEKDGYQTIRFWAGGVPAVGYRVYRLGHGPIQHSHPAAHLAGSVVENRFYRITLNPSRAALQGIYDKELGRELVDPSSPYLANEYLFVSGGGSETGRGRGAEDSRLLHPFHWLPAAQLTIHHPDSGALVSVERTPWGQEIRMKASAIHTPRIETEILLPDDAKQVEFLDQIQVDLLYAKQASYFAFPWAVQNPAFRYDIPNDFVNPAKELLEGGCSDWFSVQDLVNVENSRVSVTLAVVDAPLVCLGDIYRGRWLPQFTNTAPNVFSYALNNYWSPKWAGRKSAQLSYRYLITSGPRFDAGQAARFGRAARSPLEVAALKSSDKLPGLRGELPPGEASLVTLAPDNLVLTALKVAEDGHGLVVRVLETAGQEMDGDLGFPFMKVASATEANAVEVRGKALANSASDVRFHIRAHQALTIRVTTPEGKL